MNRSLICFLDFDNTLFDTIGAFWSDYKKFYASFGVTPQMCDEAHHELKIAHIKYHFDHHLRIINRRLPTPLPLDDVHRAFADAFPDLSKYLFPDVLPFLRRLQTLGTPTLIVSYGDPDWQEYKINAVGLFPYITERLYSGEHGDKYSFILPRIKGYQRAIFVDDDIRELDPMVQKIPTVERYVMNRRTKSTQEGIAHRPITTLAAIPLDTA